MSIYFRLKILDLSDCKFWKCERCHERKERKMLLLVVYCCLFVTKLVGGSGLVFIVVKVSRSSIRFSGLRFFFEIFCSSQISTALVLLTDTWSRSLLICSGRRDEISDPRGGVSCSGVVLVLQIERLVNSFWVPYMVVACWMFSAYELVVYFFYVVIKRKS